MNTQLGKRIKRTNVTFSHQGNRENQKLLRRSLWWFGCWSKHVILWQLCYINSSGPESIQPSYTGWIAESETDLQRCCDICELLKILDSNLEPWDLGENRVDVKPKGKTVDIEEECAHVHVYCDMSQVEICVQHLGKHVSSAVGRTTLLWNANHREKMFGQSRHINVAVAVAAAVVVQSMDTQTASQGESEYCKAGDHKRKNDVVGKTNCFSAELQ